MNHKRQSEEIKRQFLPVSPLIVNDNLHCRIHKEIYFLAFLQSINEISSEWRVLEEILDIEEAKIHRLQCPILLKQLCFYIFLWLPD